MWAFYSSIKRARMKLENISNSQIRSSLKACAALDIELCDDEYLRCFTFNSAWSDGIQVATYENGGGDDLVIVFSDDSILIKGFDHESEVSPYAQEEYGVWPGMYDGAPEKLLSILDDEAFEKEDVTFCYWREGETGKWRQGPVKFNDEGDDGSSWLLPAIKITPLEYIEWGKEYYEEDFNRISVQRVHDVFKENE